MPTAAVRWGGKPRGQLGIEDHPPRHHRGVEDDPLGVLAASVGDDGRAPGLRAGSGGGGDRDHRHHARLVDARPPVLPVLEVPDGPRLAGHQGDCLARVESAPSAEGDDPVVVLRRERFDPGGDVCLDRIAAHVGEHRAREPRLPAGPDRAGHHREWGEDGVGDEQRAPDAELAARIGQLADPAGAEADRGREAPVPPQGGRFFHHACFLPKSEASAEARFAWPGRSPERGGAHGPHRTEIRASSPRQPSEGGLAALVTGG